MFATRRGRAVLLVLAVSCAKQSAPGVESADRVTKNADVISTADYGPLQALSVLSAISARTVVEVRYLNAVDAQARFGIHANGGPVIVILSARQ